MTTIKLHILMRRVGIAKSEFDAWENNDNNGKPLVSIRAIGGTSLTRMKVLLRKEGYKFWNLRDTFKATNRAPWQVIQPKFDSEYRHLSFNVPAALQRINTEIYAREQTKIAAFFQDSAQMTRDALRVSFQGLTEHLLEQLGIDEAGKQKRFHSGSVKKMTDFITMFSNGGNMTGDDELQQYVKMAKDLIEGVDPSSVRKNKGLRETLETGFAELKERTSTLIVSPTRKFNFQAEDAPETIEEIETAQTIDDGLEIAE